MGTALTVFALLMVATLAGALLMPALAARFLSSAYPAGHKRRAELVAEADHIAHHGQMVDRLPWLGGTAKAVAGEAVPARLAYKRDVTTLRRFNLVSQTVAVTAGLWLAYAWVAGDLHWLTTRDSLMLLGATASNCIFLLEGIARWRAAPRVPRR